MISEQKLKIQGIKLGPENPLPRFKEKKREHDVAYDESFGPAEKELFAFETGYRVLPYLMQDSYSRDRKEIELKTICLENENLKALFLPEWGGRLISLYDKNLKKELLFRNPVHQPGNLAVRNAWFSGGIEWNIGIYGHTPLTCESLFFGTVEDEEGNEFLRAWEYERCRKVFYSMDFHLPPGAKQLAVHVRIVNENKEDVPMYWWTNIAVPEDKKTRVFSSADDVIYIKPQSLVKEGTVHEFGVANLQELPSLPEKDASYPANFEFASEYFFQTPKAVKSPWEAASYSDNTFFFERSTPLLRYRKMFCWGTHKGGRHWCDFLSEKGKGDYLEIQAGMAPTQVHGLKMPQKTQWDFTQFFGGSAYAAGESDGHWPEARDRIESRISAILSEEEVETLHQKYRSQESHPVKAILHKGSGWGALEVERALYCNEESAAPEGMVFPKDSLTEKQDFYLNILHNRNTTEPGSAVITDPAWEGILRKACLDRSSAWPLIQLGILLYESDRQKEARQFWLESLSINRTAQALRNLSVYEQDYGNMDQAVLFMEEAAGIMEEDVKAAITEEMLKLYLKQKSYRKAWDFYEGLPQETAQDERLISLAAIAAYETANFDFLEKVFTMEFASVKEGETRIIDLWFLYSAQKMAHARNCIMDDALIEEAKQCCPPPENIDFRMT